MSDEDEWCYKHSMWRPCSSCEAGGAMEGKKGLTPLEMARHVLRDAPGYVIVKEEELEGLRDRLHAVELERDEFIEECRDLSAVFEARFAASMNGESEERLDRGVTAEAIAREKNAVAWAIEKVGPAFEELRKRVSLAEMRAEEYRIQRDECAERAAGAVRAAREATLREAAAECREYGRRAAEVMRTVRGSDHEWAADECAERILRLLEK